MGRLYGLVMLLVCAPCSAAYWGVSTDLADRPGAQSEYEAPLLAKRGVNCAFLNPRGKKYNWPNWAGVERALNAGGISCFWDMPATIGDSERIFGFEPGTLEIDDRATDENGSRALLGSQGNFFDSRFAPQVERASAALAARVKTPVGCRIAQGVDLRSGSFDKDAESSWHTFVARFYGDDSPARDTNSDSVTFNSAHSTNYAVWSEIPLSSPKTGADSHPTPSSDLSAAWLTESFASYVDGICRILQGGSNKAVLAGPGIGDISQRSGDISLLASQSSANMLFTDSPDAVPMLRGAAAVFGKGVFAADINLIPGSIERSRNIAMRLLPFVSGATFNYSNLVRWREDEQLRKIVEFDPAFQVISELAPFAGHFHVQRSHMLWIYSIDRQSEVAREIINADCVSETTLVLNPGCIDFSRYKVIVYVPSDKALSPAIEQALNEYKLHGGTVYALPFAGLKGLIPSCLTEPQNEVLVYPGDDCVIALGPINSCSSAGYVTVECSIPDVVIFNPLTLTIQTGKPADGKLTLTETVKPGEAKLWVVKSYGKPVVLYADGTLNHAGSIEDGEIKDGVLQFKLAERAFVSSPTCPKSLVIDGKDAPFEYDPIFHLVTIKRPGELAEARLEF